VPKISTERAGAQRQRLVAAAIAAFAQDGYDATTVDAVCRASGLSKGSVYTYFATKEELFLAASEHVFEQRYAAVEQTWRSGLADAGVDVLLEAFATSLVATQPTFLRLWVEGFLVAGRIPALASMKASYHRRFGDLLVEVLTAAQNASRLDTGLDVRSAASHLMALADGLMLHRLVPGLDPDEGSLRAVGSLLALPARDARP
jgi:AcrR family transcriptional regulator